MPSPGAPDFGGISEAFNNPLQTIRDDFGTVRVDHIFSEKDSLSGVYTIDDSADFTPTSTNLYSTDAESLREQVASLEEITCLLAYPAQHGAGRVFARRIFLHRRTDARYAGGESGRLSRWPPSWRGGGRRQRGVESDGATKPGRKQQRQQPASGAKPVHL